MYQATPAVFRIFIANQPQSGTELMDVPPNAVAPAQKPSWRPAISNNYLNGFAALLHAIQAVLVFGLIAWLNSKPLDSISPEYNSQFNATASEPRLRSGIFALYRTVYAWRKSYAPKPSDNNDLSVEDQKQQPQAMFKGYVINEVKTKTGELDVRYVIAAFFVLSAVFQSIGGVMGSHKKNARLRFIEYSFSASVMIMAIAVEAGIRDAYTIEMMFVLTWATMMLGMFADVLSEMSEKLQNQQQKISEPLFEWLGPWSWLAPHAAGWVTYMTAYAPILDHYRHSIEKSDSDAKPPGFVNVIVYLQFALFSSFGLVQLYGLVNRTYVIMGSAVAYPYDENPVESDGLLFPEQQAGGSSSKQKKLAWIADATDRMYIGLSLVAKTVLAWLILSPILVDAMK